MPARQRRSPSLSLLLPHSLCALIYGITLHYITQHYTALQRQVKLPQPGNGLRIAAGELCFYCQSKETTQNRHLMRGKINYYSNNNNDNNRHSFACCGVKCRAQQGQGQWGGCWSGKLSTNRRSGNIRSINGCPVCSHVHAVLPLRKTVSAQCRRQRQKKKERDRERERERDVATEDQNKQCSTSLGESRPRLVHCCCCSCALFLLFINKRSEAEQLQNLLGKF